MLSLQQLRNLKWESHWVWSPVVGDPRFQICYFRRSFDLADPRGAELLLHVTADSRYRLYLNGELCGRGPARGDLNHYNFESYDLSNRLRPGRNVLAAQVLAYGHFGPLAEMHDVGGLAVQGTLKSPAGEVPLNTEPGSPWRVLDDQAYQPYICQPKAFFAVNPLEKFHGDRYPWGWQQVDFDDSAWQQAVSLGKGADRVHSTHPRQSWRLTPREIAHMAETPVWAETVIDAPQSDQLRALLRQPDGAAPGAAPAKASPAPGLTVPAGSQRTWTIYMGKLLTGYLHLTTRGGKGAAIRFTYAEGLERDGVKGQRDDLTYGEVPDHMPADFVYPAGRRGPDGRLRDEAWEPFCWRCGRYIRVDVTTAEEPLEIAALDFTFTSYPFQMQGSFDSNDPELRKIWDLSWHTAICCAHEHYEDCPFYEQLQYVADTRLQILVSYNVAGDDTLARAAITAFNRSRLPDGITQSRYPSSIQQIIPPFSLNLVLTIEDQYQYYGDLAQLRSLTLPIQGILHWFETYLDERGLLTRVPWWNYVDWVPQYVEGEPPEARTGACTIVNLEYVAALQSAARLAVAVGDQAQAKDYLRRAAQVQESVRRFTWSESDGLFREGPESPSFSQHANLWAILTDTAGPAQSARIMKRLMDDPRLIQTTYHHTFYLFQALVKLGAYEKLPQVIQAWRDMCKLGLSTFLESPEPSRSDCHAWSAWPMFEFQRVLLGVRPLEPGYAAALIAPRPFGTVTEARGRVTTCRGPIDVTWKLYHGRFALKATAPEGLPVRIEIPDGYAQQFDKGGQMTLGDKALAETLKF